MKLAFKFENGSSEIVLTPENSRDKTYIDLCIDGKNNIRLKPSVNESIILEFTSVEHHNPYYSFCPTCKRDFATELEYEQHFKQGCLNDSLGQ